MAETKEEAELRAAVAWMEAELRVAAGRRAAVEWTAEAVFTAAD